jgi:hypothetical protein
MFTWHTGIVHMTHWDSLHDTLGLFTWQTGNVHLAYWDCSLDALGLFLLIHWDSSHDTLVFFVHMAHWDCSLDALELFTWHTGIGLFSWQTGIAHMTRGIVHMVIWDWCSRDTLGLFTSGGFHRGVIILVKERLYSYTQWTHGKSPTNFGGVFLSHPP